MPPTAWSTQTATSRNHLTSGRVEWPIRGVERVLHVVRNDDGAGQTAHGAAAITI